MPVSINLLLQLEYDTKLKNRYKVSGGRKETIERKPLSPPRKRASGTNGNPTRCAESNERVSESAQRRCTPTNTSSTHTHTHTHNQTFPFNRIQEQKRGLSRSKDVFFPLETAIIRVGSSGTTSTTQRTQHPPAHRQQYRIETIQCSITRYTCR